MVEVVSRWGHNALLIALAVMTYGIFITLR